MEKSEKWNYNFISLTEIVIFKSVKVRGLRFYWKPLFLGDFLDYQPVLFTDEGQNIYGTKILR